jgi:hypothetical protein
MTPAEAEAHMVAARVIAEARKQVAIAAAMKLPMPAHAAAIRKAERQYCLDLAEAGRSTGIVDHVFYTESARWHE